MESVLLFKPDFFYSLYERGFDGWMSMGRELGLLYHFVLVIIGLLVCYYGFRIYRVIILSFGAIAGALLGLMLIDTLQMGGSTPNIDPVMVPGGMGNWDYVGLIGGGILGGAAAWWLSWLAIFSLGFVGCGFLGFFASSAVLPPQWALGFGIVTGVLGGVLVIRMFKPFILVLTAVLGAFDFAMGVAGILVSTGVVSVLTGSEQAGLWAFILPFVLMIILGIVNQVLDNYKDEVIDEPKAAPDPTEAPAPT